MALACFLSVSLSILFFFFALIPLDPITELGWRERNRGGKRHTQKGDRETVQDRMIKEIDGFAELSKHSNTSFP